MPVRIELKARPEENREPGELADEAVHKSGISGGHAVLSKRSLDARREPVFHYYFDVFKPGEPIQKPEGFRVVNVTGSKEVHIVGCGPAGIFAAMQCIELGLKPVLIERGKDVKARRHDLARLIKEHTVNPDSNYCFGEGGAGTFSDGKLYTRSNKRGPLQKVLASLVEHGATEQILWESHPHIGTNKLPAIIEQYRKTIVDCGGEIHFNTRVTGFTVSAGRIVKISTVHGEFSTQQVILATGHSARDIFELLHKAGIGISAKPFAIGVRMEHHQSLIDRIQYHCNVRNPNLPAASYSLVEQVGGRGVFSFCMCPGGIIAPASTSPGEIVVNGWSPSKRNGEFANSGFVVTADHRDYDPQNSGDPLAAMHYQAQFEQLAFATCGNLTAPAQRIEDFIQKKASSGLPNCSYLPGIASRPMDEILSKSVVSRIREALVILGKKMPGFRTNDAILVGVESRTSSPVRINRDKESMQHPQVANLFPCGEGAGYAGGIMSAALDGMKVAQAVALSVSN